MCIPLCLVAPRGSWFLCPLKCDALWHLNRTLEGDKGKMMESVTGLRRCHQSARGVIGLCDIQISKRGSSLNLHQISVFLSMASVIILHIEGECSHIYY